MNAAEDPVWPNIVLVAGNVYGLEAPVSLPVACLRSGASAEPPVPESRHARPLRPCIATGPRGRAWLGASRQAGFRPALAEREIVLLPGPEKSKRNSLQQRSLSGGASPPRW